MNIYQLAQLGVGVVLSSKVIDPQTHLLNSELHISLTRSFSIVHYVLCCFGVIVHSLVNRKVLNVELAVWSCTEADVFISVLWEGDHFRPISERFSPCVHKQPVKLLLDGRSLTLPKGPF